MSVKQGIAKFASLCLTEILGGHERGSKTFAPDACHTQITLVAKVSEITKEACMKQFGSIGGGAAVDFCSRVKLRPWEDTGTFFNARMGGTPNKVDPRGATSQRFALHRYIKSFSTAHLSGKC